MAIARLLPGEANRNRVIGRYKRLAKQRGLSFNLNIAQCTFLFKSNCFYCGTAPYKIELAASCPGEYIYNGIDRIDNDLGYESTNVVASCVECNKAKAQMTFVEFLQLTKRVYEQYNRSNI